MQNKMKKRIWAIGSVGVPLCTLAACICYIKAVWSNDPSGDRVGLVLGIALFAVVAITFVVAAMEMMFSMRYFLFEKAGDKSRSLRLIHQTRLITSCVLLGAVLITCCFQWLAIPLADWDMILTLTICYWFLFVGIKITQIIMFIKVRRGANGSS